MITGFDSVVMAPGPVEGAIGQFLDAQVKRWPEMMVCFDDDAEFFAWRSKGNASPPPDTAWILVARDPAALERWDDDGYALDATGEGPFAVAYEPCEERTLRVTAKEDPYGGARRGFRHEPYDVTVIGSRLSLITVVLPDEDSEFSLRILDDLYQALATRG